jgi:hypothetical protein
MCKVLGVVEVELLEDALVWVTEDAATTSISVVEGVSDADVVRDVDVGRGPLVFG